MSVGDVFAPDPFDIYALNRDAIGDEICIKRAARTFSPSTITELDTSLKMDCTALVNLKSRRQDDIMQVRDHLIQKET